jgi:hypothetical protein
MRRVTFSGLAGNTIGWDMTTILFHDSQHLHEPQILDPYSRRRMLSKYH